MGAAHVVGRFDQCQRRPLGLAERRSHPLQLPSQTAVEHRDTLHERHGTHATPEAPSASSLAPTMGMQGLEGRLERMVEGVFRRSRNSIRPIELGRRLIREMDDHRSVDVKGQRIAPNDFVVMLSADDHTGLRRHRGRAAHRARRGSAASTRARRATTSWARSPSSSASTTRSSRAASGSPRRLKQPEPGKRPGTIVMPSGDRIELGDGKNLIGRLADCVVIVSDSNTSRHHAKITSLRQRVRDRRPRLHQRHVRQRRSPRRRPPPRRRRHHHRRIGQLALRGLVTRSRPSHVPEHRLTHDRPGTRHPQAGAAGAAVPVLRPRAVGGLERGPSTGRRTSARSTTEPTGARATARRRRRPRPDGASPSPPKAVAGHRPGWWCSNRRSGAAPRSRSARAPSHRARDRQHDPDHRRRLHLGATTPDRGRRRITSSSTTSGRATAPTSTAPLTQRHTVHVGDRIQVGYTVLEAQ